MPDISGFPYADVEFKKDGSLDNPADTQRIVDFVNSNQLTDLLVISHGWNNNMDEARDLYRGFFKVMKDERDRKFAQSLANRKLGVLGILWPSKKFTDDDLKPSGAAALGGDLPDEIVIKRLDSLKGGFDRPDADAILDQLKLLVPKLKDSEQARRKFVDDLRSLPQKKEKTAEEASDKFYSTPTEQVLPNLSRPSGVPGAPAAGPAAGPGAAMPAGPAAPPGGAGPAAGLGSFFNRIKHAAEDLLNLTTYFQMKERAGTVGTGGVHKLLSDIKAANNTLKMHFIGHSFGGRLVTACAKGPDGKPAIKPSTMTLLQAAFSHNGFSPNTPGFFRSVVDDAKVAGPILITHSDKDTAVGRAYPLASRMSGDIAAKLGDRNDKFGGIGRNGAVDTPKASDGQLLPLDAAYNFEAGKIYNLEANNIIGGHSDLFKPQIAYALLTAIAAP